MLVRKMTCIKQIFSKRRRLKVGAAFTSCRHFRAELVRNLLSWSTPVCFIEHYICSIALKLTCQVNFPTWQVRHESSGLPIIHHSGYACDLPPNHRFPMGKFPRVLHFLIKDQIITEKQVSGKKKKILFMIIIIIISNYSTDGQLIHNILMIMLLSLGFIWLGWTRHLCYHGHYSHNVMR